MGIPFDCIIRNSKKLKRKRVRISESIGRQDDDDVLLRAEQNDVSGPRLIRSNAMRRIVRRRTDTDPSSTGANIMTDSPRERPADFTELERWQRRAADIRRTLNDSYSINFDTLRPPTLHRRNELGAIRNEGDTSSDPGVANGATDAHNDGGNSNSSNTNGTVAERGLTFEIRRRNRRRQRQVRRTGDMPRLNVRSTGTHAEEDMGAFRTSSLRIFNNGPGEAHRHIVVTSVDTENAEDDDDDDDDDDDGDLSGEYWRLE